MDLFRTGSAEDSGHLDQLDGGLGGIHCEICAFVVCRGETCGVESEIWQKIPLGRVKSGRQLFCAIWQGFRPLRWWERVAPPADKSHVPHGETPRQSPNARDPKKMNVG